MRNILIVIIFFVFSYTGSAQEFNCTVTVNSDQISQTNKQIFKTLERSLNDFINKNKWTNNVYKENERINAQIYITITQFDSNRFDGNIQIQSTRPVYNTTYDTSVFNYKDSQIAFEYVEFQPLIFNLNVFESNLISVMSYYAYVMLGLDADTFSLEGGKEHFKTAQKIVTQAQGSNSPGWSQTGDRNRFELIDDLLSNTYREYHVAMYNYHRKGLDILGDNNSTGKQVIAGTMRLFETIQKRRPNAFLTQIFFETKSEEIKSVFSGGPKVDIVKLKSSLNSIAPYFSSTWNDIKY